MKYLYITLITLCISSMTFSQNVSLETGRHTNCRGRGTCSISTMNKNSKNTSDFNATFIQLKNGNVLLRVYRNKITTEQEVQLLGEIITPTNQKYLAFLMEEDLPLSDEIKQASFSSLSGLDSLMAKEYRTIISEKYIDIVIVEN